MSDITHRMLKLRSLESTLRGPAFQIAFDMPTVIWVHGPNGSGKSTIIESIRLPLFHTFWDTPKQSFAKAGKSSKRFRDYFSHDNGLASTSLTLSCGGTQQSEWSVNGKGTVKTGGFTLAGTTSRLTDIAELLRRNSRKLNEGLTAMMMGSLTEADLLAALDPSLHDVWKLATRSEALPADKISAAAARAAEEVRGVNAEIKALVLQKPPMVPPKVPPEEISALERLMDIAQSKQHLHAQWDRYDEQVAVTKQWSAWIEDAKVSVSALETKRHQITAAAQRRLRFYRGRIDTLTAYLETMDDPNCCATCGAARAAAQIRNDLENDQRTLARVQAEIEGNREVQAINAEIREINAALRQRQSQIRHAAKPLEPRPSESAERLAGDRAALQATHNNKLRMQGAWVAEARRVENLEDAKRRKASWDKLAAAVESLRESIVSSRKDAFIAQVNRFLPSVVGDEVFIDNVNASVGVLRNGFVFEGLSDGEWAALCAAVAIASNEMLAIPSPVILPDVNMHPDLIQACCERWSTGFRGTIIIQSAMGPHEGWQVPEGTQIIDALAATGRTRKVSSEAPVAAAGAEVDAPSTAPSAPSEAEQRMAAEAEALGLEPATSAEAAPEALKRGAYEWVPVEKPGDLLDIVAGAKVMVRMFLPTGEPVDIKGDFTSIKEGKLHIRADGAMHHIDRSTLLNEDRQIQLIAYDKRKSAGVRDEAVRMLTLRLGVPSSDRLLNVALTAELVEWVDGPLSRESFCKVHRY